METYTDEFLVDAGNIGRFEAKCALPCKDCSGLSCTSCYSDISFTGGRIFLNQNL